MKTNYDINKEKILDDYYKCIGAFHNCEELYNKKHKYKITKKDTEEQKLVKKGREEDILSNLGKVGEKALKYIIGLENLKINPNQDEQTFEALWKKPNTLKDFAKKHGIPETNLQFIELLNYHDDNHQKAHNFDYWFSIINLLMKSTSKKLEKFVIYSLQTEELIKYCKENDEFKYYGIYIDSDHEELSLAFRTALFPHLINLQYDNVPAISDDEVSKIIKLKREAIAKNGDIFTRLRYASNNPSHTQFNLDEVFKTIRLFVEYISMIHENNDNLDFDLDKTYAKKQSLKYAKELKVTEEEINNLFSLDIMGTDLALTIFETNYTYKGIKDLLKVGVKKEDLRKVMREGLSANIINQFFKRGITDYYEMRKMIDKYLDELYKEEEYIYKKY